MARLMTRGSTEVLALVIAYTVTVLAGGILAGADMSSMTVVYGAAVLICAVAGLWLDGFGGLGVGLLAMTGYVAIRQAVGPWEPRLLLLLTAQVATLMFLGWISGVLGTQLARLAARRPPGETSIVAAERSLGLLPWDIASLRLEEELARATRRRSTLGLLVVDLSDRRSSISPDARTAARRAVARQVESLADLADVPFATEDGLVGSILVDTSHTRAWDALGTLVDALGRAQFADREAGVRRHVSECASLTTGLAFAQEADTPATLLERARRSPHATAQESGRP